MTGSLIQLNPAAVAGLAIGVALAIGFPLLLGVFLWRRTGVSWKYFGFGALVFVVAQFLLRMPLLAAIQTIPGFMPTVTGNSALLIAWSLLLAASAALFEETGRWLGYRYLVRERSWRVGCMYGLGHGGIEAFWIGTLVLLGLVNYVALALGGLHGLPADQAAGVAQGMNRAYAGASIFMCSLGGIERVFTVIWHVAASLIVLQSFTRGQARWFWYAVAYHTVVDAVTVLGPTFFPDKLLVEAAIGLFGLSALWVVLRLRPAPERMTLTLQPQA